MMLVRNKNLVYEIEVDDDTVSGSSKVNPKDELIAGLKAERLRLNWIDCSHFGGMECDT